MKNIAIGLYTYESELEQLRFYLRTGRMMSREELAETGNRKFDSSYSGVVTNDDFGTLIKGIQILCSSCYWFGINPIPRLRRLFPEFEWLYLNINNQSNDLFGEIRAIDPEYVFSLSSDFEAVVARKRGRRKESDFKIFISGDSESEGFEKPILEIGYQIFAQ